MAQTKTSFLIPPHAHGFCGACGIAGPAMCASCRAVARTPYTFSARNAETLIGWRSLSSYLGDLDRIVDGRGVCETVRVGR